MVFPQLPDLLNAHLHPMDPIVINYTIRVDKPYNMSDLAYDIEVESDDPISSTMASIVNGNMNTVKEIGLIDDKIVGIIQNINTFKLKRDFMLAFIKSPIDFIEQWVASQSRDLEVKRGRNQ